MKFKWFLSAFLLVIASFLVFAQIQPVKDSSALKNAVVLIIRHAEKPDRGVGLSAVGKARAQAYVNYFKNYSVDGQPLKLTCLFAAADSKKSHRSRLTLEPLGKALKLPVNDRFKNKNFRDLVSEIQSQPHGSAILIAWHHGNIPDLLKAFGAAPQTILPKGEWPDDAYDWVIQLRFDQNGRLQDAKRISENLLPNDTNKTARQFQSQGTVRVTAQSWVS